VADCSPVDRRFAPAPPHAAFDTFLLCRTSSTFANNKFDGYHLKICSTPVSFGPASPDAGVELLRQLFLQCVSEPPHVLRRSHHSSCVWATTSPVSKPPHVLSDASSLLISYKISWVSCLSSSVYVLASVRWRQVQISKEQKESIFISTQQSEPVQLSCSCLNVSQTRLQCL